MKARTISLNIIDDEENEGFAIIDFIAENDYGFLSLNKEQTIELFNRMKEQLEELS